MNYELGFRYGGNRLNMELMAFYNDYENLVGVCTNASGGGCEPGEIFNGDGVKVPGLELSMGTEFEIGDGWQLPVQLAYTWMDAEFQTDFDSEFFGDVSKGDPVPYIPEQQLWASIGLERGPWSLYLSGNHVDSVCTEASCGAFERTESATIVDFAAHYQFNNNIEVYGVVENLTDDMYIASRNPYGARPNKPRSFTLGLKYAFDL
jgi:Fe(3+) dicitrate transport protein